MSTWSYKNKPTWFPTAVATSRGWENGTTNELLVAIGGLDTKNTDANSVPTFTLAVPANATYTLGQSLIFTVTVSEAVEVAGTPALSVTIGSTVRLAVFDPATSTTTSLKFVYVIVAGDIDGNGIVVANTVTLGSTGKGKNKILDAITGTSGEVIADAALTFTVPSTTGILVSA
jgi:hypothetical protein